MKMLPASVAARLLQSGPGSAVAWAAVCLWIGVLGCGREPEPVAAIRLFDLPPEANVSSTEIAALPQANSLRKSNIGTTKFPSHLRSLALSTDALSVDSRLALVAPGSGSFRFEIVPPEDPVLRLAVAIQSDESTDLRLEIVVHAAGERTALFDSGQETVPLNTWQDLEFNLDRWALQPIEIELAIDSERPTRVSPEGDSTGSLAAFSTPEVASRQVEPPYDLLLISLDTLRADHLGVYGYERPTSPSIDRFAARSVRFTTALAHSPWTKPSHLAMLTGLYPSATSRSTPYLAQFLWHEGFRTAAATGGGMMDFRLGFDSGFEEFALHDWLRDLDSVTSWLERHRGRQRFLFLHTYEPHDPYIDQRFTEGLDPGRLTDYFNKGLWNKLKKQITPAERTYIEALYDGDIAFTDEQIGELLERLESRGLLDRTIVVITSDHGEQFWEHGTWRHGQDLYEHQLRVPLILYLPDSLRQSHGIDSGGLVIEQPVDHIDLVPTLLQLLGIDPGIHQFSGRSLLPLLSGGELSRRPSFAERVNITSFDRWSIRAEPYKLIHSIPTEQGAEAGAEEAVVLFRLDRDPDESTDLARERPEVLQKLLTQLTAWRDNGGTVDDLRPNEDELDPDLVERLKALGYLN